MIKKIILVLCTWLLSFSAILLIPSSIQAGVPAPPLPPLIVPGPPPVFLIPGTYAYFAPDVDADLFFYGGYWYRPHGGGWYRSSNYGGPWGFIVIDHVPGVLIKLPHGYRNVPPRHQRIPYGQLKKNWKAWERDKHWDKPGKMGKPGKQKAGMKKQKKSEHGSGKKGHGK